MARVGVLNNERGAVYVEFLIAFFPVFLMFLGICQVALLTAAEAVVRHAAYSAARTAIVVLEDKPSNFSDAPRGSLSKGSPSERHGIDQIVTSLAVLTGSGGGIVSTFRSRSLLSLGEMLVPLARTVEPEQPGARVAPIRAAAQMALIPLAPKQSAVTPGNDSVGNALFAPSGEELQFAAKYTKAAASITIHDTRDDLKLAADPVDPHANVTARVTYAYHCTIPVVRALMCQGLETLAQDNPLMKRPSQALSSIVGKDARFMALTAVATLPNQGADYTPREED
jgi:hypothetical protein